MGHIETLSSLCLSNNQPLFFPGPLSILPVSPSITVPAHTAALQHTGWGESRQRGKGGGQGGHKRQINGHMLKRHKINAEHLLQTDEKTVN